MRFKYLLPFLLAPALSLGQGKHYKTGSIEVELQQGDPGHTEAYVDEKFSADHVIIQAFYRTEVDGVTVMLHKVEESPVGSHMTEAIDIPLNLKEIVFIRVLQLGLLNSTDFGKE